MNVQTVLVFAPHPDDEVIACGGSIIKHVNNGDDVHILFSTDGRNSHSAVLGMLNDPSPEELLVIRRQEAISCAAVLGIPEANLHFLGIEDTQMGTSGDEYRERLAHKLNAFGQVTKVYLPHDIREANIDHRLTGKLALELVGQMCGDIEINKYIVWTQETEREVDFSNRGAGYEPGSLQHRGEKLIEVDISAELEQKKEAFRQHKTQISLFSETQHRPVLPESFCDKVYQSKIEQFWRAK